MAANTFNEEGRITIKALAACSMAFVLFWLARQKDSASQEPGAESDATRRSSVPEDAPQEQQ